jgi:SNF family Na+-dependent transporter
MDEAALFATACSSIELSEVPTIETSTCFSQERHQLVILFCVVGILYGNVCDLMKLRLCFCSETWFGFKFFDEMDDDGSE